MKRREVEECDRTERKAKEQKREAERGCGGQIKMSTDRQTESGIIRQHNLLCPTA